MPDLSPNNETALPRAVRAQMDRVRLRIESRKPPGAAAPATPDAEGGQPPAEQQDAAAAPTTPAHDAAADAAPAADPRENDPTYWKHRFKVTEGVLRSAQERYENATRDMQAELTTLREKVRSLEAEKRNAEPAKADVSRFFDAEQIERFGEEQCQAMADAAIRAARTELQGRLDAELAPIREREQRQAQEQAQTRESKFWARLAELVPTWEDINAQDEFKEFCLGEDEATGMRRQDILERHQGSLNADGVAKVFQAFQRTKARPTPPQTPAGRAAGGADDSAPRGNAPAKGYPSREEIRDYYKRAAIGKVKEQERMEFEARLALKHAA